MNKVEEIKEQLQAELSKRFSGTAVFDQDRETFKEIISQIAINYLSIHCEAEDRIKVNAIQEGDTVTIAAGNLYTFILLCGYEKPSPHCRDWMKEWESSKALYKFNEVTNQYECYLLNPTTITCKIKYQEP